MTPETQMAQAAMDDMFMALMAKCSRVAYHDRQKTDSVQVQYLPLPEVTDFKTAEMKIVGPILQMQLHASPFDSAAEALAYARGQIDAYWRELCSRGPCHAFVRSLPEISSQIDFASNSVKWSVHCRISFFDDYATVKVSAQ